MFGFPIFAIATFLILLFARLTLPRKGNNESADRANARYERLFPIVMLSIFVALIAVVVFVQTR